MSISIFAKDLVKKYGSRTVVNHVSFDVNQGEIVGLLGPNGAGKTTSFYQVVGLVRPDSGKVFLNEEDITALPMFFFLRKRFCEASSYIRKLKNHVWPKQSKKILIRLMLDCFVLPQ